MSYLKMAWKNLTRGINFWQNYVVCNVGIWHVIHWLLKHIQTTLKQNSQSLPLVVITPTLFNHWNSIHNGLFLNMNIFLTILLNFPGKKKKNLWTFIHSYKLFELSFFHSNLLNLNSFNRHRHSNVQHKCTWSAQGQKQQTENMVSQQTC